MKPKTVILMVVAISCGLAASYMTSRLLADRPEAPPEEEKVMVLVAKRNIEMGTPIKNPQDWFKEKAFLRGEVPQGAITDFSLLKDRYVSKPLALDQHVTQEFLLDKERVGLAPLLPDNMRAVGLRVNMSTTAGGFASLPKSRVDVVWTKRTTDGDGMTKIILQNVLVVAADEDMKRQEDATRGRVASVVTVAVTPEEAQRIILAQETGTLGLILRKFGDQQKTDTSTITVTDLIKGDTKKAKRVSLAEAGNGEKVPEGVEDLPPDVAKKGSKVVRKEVADEPPPPKTHTVTIYNGDELSRTVFILDNDNQVTRTEVTPANKPAPAQPKEAPKETPKPATDAKPK